MTKTSLSGLVAIAVAGALAGCSSNHKTTGTAHLSVGFHSTAESALAVTSVTVQVSGPGITTTLFRPLAQNGGTGPWLVAISNIPATPVNQTDDFYVEAKDSAGTLLFSGRADVAIIAGQDAEVDIIAQAQTPSTSTANSPPYIGALTASAATLTSLQSVQFSAVAYDPQGYPMHVAWTATRAGTPVGSFDPAGMDVSPGQYFPTTYTAPATDGDILITATVSQIQDPPPVGGNLTTSESFHISVVSTTSGTVTVSVTFNNSPSVNAVTFSPLRPQAGQTVTLHADTSDPDTGDVIHVNWILSGCPVSGFTGADPTGEVFNHSDVTYVVPNAAYFAANTGGNPIQCTFSVYAFDYDAQGNPRGGSGAISVSLIAGPTLNVAYAPVIDSFSQDFTQDLQGTPLNLYVHAHIANPQAGLNLVHYSWTTNDGAITVPDFANHALWTPTPNCVENGNGSGAEAYADVYDDYGHVTRQTFKLDTCLPRGCAGVLASHPEWTIPAQNSSYYQIDPDRTGPISPFTVYCDFSLPGGGWALVGNLGHSHLLTIDDSLLSKTSATQGGGTLSPGYDAYTPGQFQHFDLREFNSYGADYTILVETGDYSHGDASGNQLTYFRPKAAPACDDATCAPGIAGGNWLASGRDLLFQVANYPSQYPAIPLKWIDSPGFNFSGAPPSIALLGYNVVAPAGCTAGGDCPCADTLGTKICRHPAGGILSGNIGVGSASTSLLDYFIGYSDNSVAVGGGGNAQNPAMIWLHEGKLDQFVRSPFPGLPEPATPGPVVLSSPSQSQTQDYDGSVVNLSIVATLPAPIAGKPNVLSYAWTTNNGTVSTTGAPGNAVWHIASGCTPDSKATITVTPDNTAGLSASYDFLLDTCPARGCADVLAVHPDAINTLKIWTIDPYGPGQSLGPHVNPFRVYCDLYDSLPGGWTLVGVIGSNHAFSSSDGFTSNTGGPWISQFPGVEFPNWYPVPGIAVIDSWWGVDTYSHFDLTSFDIYDSNYVLRIDTGDGPNYGSDQNGVQLSFFRPKQDATCSTPGTCKPSVAGGNWIGAVGSKFQIANYSSEYSVDPFSWMDAPGFDFTGTVPAPGWAMFGYNVPNPPGCTATSCLCANATIGTRLCYSPPGTMVSGNNGVTTANSALDDLFTGSTDSVRSYGAGGGAHNASLVWLHDGALPAGFAANRKSFPAVGTSGSGVQSAAPIIDSPATNNFASGTLTATGQSFPLSVSAHIAEVQAGDVNVIRFHWSTNSGTVTANSLNLTTSTATWQPDCSQTPPPTTPQAWVDITDLNNSNFARETYLLTNSCP